MTNTNITPKTNQIFTHALLVLIAVIWASTFILTKETFGTVNPVTLVAYRFGIASLTLGLFLIFRHKNIFHNFPMGLVTGFFLWLFYIAQNFGLQATSINNANFLLGIFVVFIPFLSVPILKRPIKSIEYFVLALSLFGIWILTGGISSPNAGDWMCILGAICYAFFIVLSSKFGKRQDPLIETFQQFLVVTILSLGTAMIFNLPLTIGSYQSFLITLYLALLPSLFCFVILNRAEKTVDPFIISLIISLDTFIAPVFAAIFVKEPLTTNIILGGGIIGLAILLTNEKLRSKVSQLIYLKANDRGITSKS